MYDDEGDTEKHAAPTAPAESVPAIELFLDALLDLHRQTLELFALLRDRKFADAESVAKAAISALLLTSNALQRLEKEGVYPTTHAQLALAPIVRSLQGVFDRALRDAITPSLYRVLQKLRPSLGVSDSSPETGTR